MEWISVKDRLPELKNKYEGYEESDDVLVFGLDMKCSIGRYGICDEKIPFWTRDDGGLDGIIYWMPLPVPPES